MVTNAAIDRTTEMSHLLDEVTRELIMTDVENGDGLIALSQTYPGGSAVVVRIRRDRQNFFVSDQGNGFLEAEHMGGLNTFGRIAPAVAADFGVRYDGQMVFAVEVSREWLANAILFTGSASRRAVERTAEKMAEERERSQRIVFQDRLRETFAGRAAFDVDYRGRSTKQWKFAAMVQSRDHRALFDIATPHHVSINGTIVKFQDISRLEEPPSTVVALANKSKMDTADITLLSQAVDKVISLNAPREKLLQAA